MDVVYNLKPLFYSETYFKIHQGVDGYQNYHELQRLDISAIFWSLYASSAYRKEPRLPIRLLILELLIEHFVLVTCLSISLTSLKPFWSLSLLLVKRKWLQLNIPVVTHLCNYKCYRLGRVKIHSIFKVSNSQFWILSHSQGYFHQKWPHPGHGAGWTDEWTVPRLDPRRSNMEVDEIKLFFDDHIW